MSFGLNSAWCHLLNFCKVFLMNCNLVGSCVSTIFCLLHSILMYDLCILIMWFLLQSIFVGMHHGWILCDNHDCVGIQLSFKYFLKSHLYAHDDVIVNIFWKYVGFECDMNVLNVIWMWQHMNVNVFPPSTNGFGNLTKWRKEVKFFQKLSF